MNDDTTSRPPVRRVVAPSQAPPAAPSVQETPEEKLFAFVNEQIEVMSKYSDLGGTTDAPGFYELNEALLSFHATQCSLITLEMMAKMERMQAKDALDDFLSEKYMLAREQLNTQSLAAAKWYSTKELEYYVRNTWHDEYIRLSREFECADSKLATVRRLLDSLSDLKYNLGRICKNIETEMANTRVPDGYAGD